VAQRKEMSTDFVTNLVSKAADDLNRFSVEFPLFIVAFMLVLLTVTVIFRTRKGMTYGELVKAESEKHMKQVAKQIKKEKLYELVDLDIGSLIGSELYVYQNIDFLFDFLVEVGTENEYEDDEKKLRKYIRKNSKGMGEVFKKNIVEIYLKIDDRKESNINFFHLYWYAYNFPHLIDISLDGNFVLDTREFSIDDMVNIFENPDKRFDFEEYFYFVIGRINDYQFEMKTYMKSKEIFSEKITQFLDSVAVKQKREIKIHTKKDIEPKTKEIYKQYKRHNPKPFEPTDLEKVLPIVTDENDVPAGFVEQSQKEVQISQQNNQKNKENSAPNSIPKQVEQQQNKKEENPDVELNKPYVDENGNFTTKNLQKKKEILKDVDNQNEAVKQLQEEKFLEEEEIEVASVESENQEPEKNRDINSLVDFLQNDAQDNKPEQVEPSSDKVVAVDDKNSTVEDEEAEDETQFETAKQIKKKQFFPIRDFPSVLKTVQNDAVVHDTLLIFKHQENVYISSEYLFFKIQSQYTLKKELSKFSLAFARYLSESLDIFNNRRRVEYKNININVKVQNEEKQIGSLFLIFSAKAIEKNFNPEYFKKIRKLKELKKFDFEKIDAVVYLKSRMEK
jgi:hypothetical protein